MVLALLEATKHPAPQSQKPVRPQGPVGRDLERLAHLLDPALNLVCLGISGSDDARGLAPAANRSSLLRLPGLDLPGS